MQREVGWGRGRCTRSGCLCECPHGVAVAGLCCYVSRGRAHAEPGIRRPLYWAGGDLLLAAVLLSQITKMLELPCLRSCPQD